MKAGLLLDTMKLLGLVTKAECALALHHSIAYLARFDCEGDHVLSPEIVVLR